MFASKIARSATLSLAVAAVISSIAVPATAGVTIFGGSEDKQQVQLPDFVKLVEDNGPGVVNIQMIRNARTVENAGIPGLDPRGAEIFRRFGIPFDFGPQEIPEQRGTGSGFIVSSDGIIMTNAHVVEGADELIVRLTDKREFKGKVLGSDKQTDIAVIKTLTDGGDGKEIYRIAKSIEDALAQNLKLKTTIGIGTVVSHIRDLARAYKEAGVAIDVGKVFDTEKTIITYENLGIGRLIYQLPTVMCDMFLQEVFKKNPIDALDQETLFTINKFFENNLNVSETARKLFVHRNTLVYRLEKIKKLTGLDLREFDDAITFKVALMVKKYLVSRGIEN